MADYNQMCMVSPSGKIHTMDGLSHPDWAHENRYLVGWKGTKDIDFHPTDDESEAVFDNMECTALDAFKWAGWIRVKPDAGVEVSSINDDNIDLIKKILRAIAKENPGRTLYIDDGERYPHVSVSMTGRPNFQDIDDALEREKRLYGRY